MGEVLGGQVVDNAARYLFSAAGYSAIEDVDQGRHCDVPWISDDGVLSVLD